MGYESRLIIVQRVTHDDNDFVYGDEFARFDLCCMGREMVNGKSFTDIFDTPIDFDIYRNYSNGECEDDDHRSDCYGDHCKYADLHTVIDWLSASETAREYRRAKNLLFCLMAMNNTIEGLVAVHFGY